MTNQTFTNFVSGQLTEAVIIGVLCFFGMLILGIPYAGAVSAFVAVTALVPIFGAWIGGRALENFAIWAAMLYNIRYSHCLRRHKSLRRSIAAGQPYLFFYFTQRMAI